MDNYFYVTYLCVGFFIDNFTASIIKKVKIALHDRIIEDMEWKQNHIKTDELELYLSNKCHPVIGCHVCAIIPTGIELVVSDTYDLFLEESCDTNLDGVYVETFTKYILVKNKYTYIINHLPNSKVIH